MDGGKNIGEDEIDLVELAKTIWGGRMFVAKVTGVFVILGLVIAFTSPVEFESYSTLLPERQQASLQNLGGLGGLAGLAGIDIGNNTPEGALSPQLYPEIVKSLPFILEVMNDTIFFQNKNLYTTPFHYFTEISKPNLLDYVLSYTVGIPTQIKHIFKNKEQVDPDSKIDSKFYKFSQKDWKIIGTFKERIKIQTDEITGIIKVIVEMPDAYACAQLTDKIVSMITVAVTKYKTDKTQNSLDFVERSYIEAKIKYERLQYKLAIASDRNKNLSSAVSEIDFEKIQNEYNVAFEIYKGLASQVEQTKIKLKEETPVFTVLEPVRIPSDKNKPKRTLILIGFTIIGMMIAIFTLIVKKRKLFIKPI